MNDSTRRAAGEDTTLTAAASESYRTERFAPSVRLGPGDGGSRTEAPTLSLESETHDMKNATSGGGFLGFWKKRSVNGWIVFYFCIYLVLVIKLVTLRSPDDNLLFGIYSLAVSFYIISRFLLAHFYEPHDAYFDSDFRPTVTFAVPSKNEGENIRETILRIARSDYPKEKFDVIAIDDGSTD